MNNATLRTPEDFIILHLLLKVLLLMIKCYLLSLSIFSSLAQEYYAKDIPKQDRKIISKAVSVLSRWRMTLKKAINARFGERIEEEETNPFIPAYREKIKTRQFSGAAIKFQGTSPSPNRFPVTTDFIAVQLIFSIKRPFAVSSITMQKHKDT